MGTNYPLLFTNKEMVYFQNFAFMAFFICAFDIVNVFISELRSFVMFQKH